MRLRDQTFEKARLFRAFLLFATFLSGCASTQEKIQSHLEEIERSGYRIETMRTSSFDLLMALPVSSEPSQALNIVIEGDGYAWVTRNRPSDNPTPKNPVGFYIARQQNALYLARPCQYISSARCSPSYWTEKRFNKDVITAYQDALDELSTRYNHPAMNLIGYSGGAYIALVLAATRNDIKTVTSVAGLMDPEEWTRFHRISGLDIQYDAEYLRQHSKNTQFLHVCGLEDAVIPCSITEDFILDAHKQGFLNHQEIRLPGDHQEIWKRGINTSFMRP